MSRRPNKNYYVFYDNHVELLIYDQTEKETKTEFDIEDYEKLNKYRWRLGSRGYIVSGCKPYLLMHRIILNLQPKFPIVDHIDRNRLNNRKSNLRIATFAENAANKSIQKNNTSGHVGVTYDKSRNKWMAYIKQNKKTIYLGRFERIEEAIKCRDEKSVELFENYNPIMNYEKYKPELQDLYMWKGMEKE